MRRLVIMALLISCAAAGENLLANPGFEQLVQGHPAQWHIFVEPQQGAVGVIDDEVVAQGQYSAKLHIPKPYAEEPANNWSQNILADVSGKEVVVRGRIKTEEASEAALWLQCCRMRPFRFLKFVTSKTTTPVYGTMDWTDIEMRVRVPAMTDYLVLRCVLMGQGTAWFDDLSVAEEPKEKAKPKQEPENKGKTEKPDKDAEKETSEAQKASPTSEDMAKAEARASKVATDSLLESHKALLETNKTLRDMNASLTSQVVALREELREIRRELAALRARSFTKSTPVAAPKPPRPPEKPEVKSEPVPPLVPHGYEQRSEAP